MIGGRPLVRGRAVPYRGIDLFNADPPTKSSVRLAPRTIPAVLLLAAAPAVPAAPPAGPNAAGDANQQFVKNVAPVLARRCLECHGPTSRKGDFDLSHRDRLAAGGANGPAVIAGNAGDSPLWQYVEGDAMPPDGPPLSAEEKTLLRAWIDAGAAWPADDPWAVLRHADASDLGAGWVRRLTVPEYVASVRAGLGVDLAADARRLLPRDLRADGFQNTSYNLGVDLGHVRAYAELARIAVARADVPALIEERAPGADLDGVIRRLGRSLLRGPLSDEETAAFRRVADAVTAEGGDDPEAIGYVLEAMLQSPRFLYRIENQRGDGARRPVGGYELAARLSYALWGGPPDEPLLNAAEAGDLTDPASVEAQIERMLDDPRAQARSARFAHEWLNLDRLDALSPAPETFPDWDPALADDMRAETLAYFTHLAWRTDRPLTALLNAPVGFLTPRLAEHYGVAWDPNAVLTPNPEPAGLLALYAFDGDGNVVRDRSGVGEPLDLTIETPAAVRRTPGGLEVTGEARIAGDGPATKIIDAVRATGGVTIEAWLTPAEKTQTGPARIVTISDGASERNVTLGQDGGRYDARLRSSRATDANGRPSSRTDENAVRADRPSHVVFARRSVGRTHLWVDGVRRRSDNSEGDLKNWDDGFRLALANEPGADRPWRGTLHRVAIYGRALTAEEVEARAASPWRVNLEGDPTRGGLLTQGATLTVGGDEGSTVTRGLFVLRDLLLGDVGDPPPGVDTTPVPPEPGRSQRQIAEGRLADAACAGCHRQFEPFSFALERFDGLGAYREIDRHGNALREDGAVQLPGGGGTAGFGSAATFMDMLAASEPVRRGLTRKLTQFALGRPLTAADEPQVQDVHDRAWGAAAPYGPGTYKSLIAAVAASDLMRTTRTEPGAGDGDEQ